MTNHVLYKSIAMYGAPNGPLECDIIVCECGWGEEVEEIGWSNIFSGDYELIAEDHVYDATYDD